MANFAILDDFSTTQRHYGHSGVNGLEPLSTQPDQPGPIRYT